MTEKKKSKLKKKLNNIESLFDTSLDDLSSLFEDDDLLEVEEEVYQSTPTQLSSLEFDNIPVIPVQDMVVFPNGISTIFVRESKAINAVYKAIEEDSMSNKVFIVYQNNDSEEITQETISEYGILGNVIQYINLPDGTMKVLADGTNRARIKKIYNQGSYVRGCVESYVIDNLDYLINSSKVSNLTRQIFVSLKEYCNYKKKSSLVDLVKNLPNIANPDYFVDIITANMDIDLSEKYLLLANLNVYKRLEHLFSIINRELEILKLDRNIQDNVKKNMDKNHRDYYLTEQMKAIKKELGEGDHIVEMNNKYQKTVKEKRLSEQAHEKIRDEINKLKNMPSNSSDASIIKTYLELIFSLPWSLESRVNNNINKASKVLNDSHYGMEKPKGRILESIAVQIKTGMQKKAILCLYGPPGVGKTSLAKAIAEATGREFVKISLGGLKDEAEIRGHRKTYIGSMPGKIISALKKAKVNNPVILLDEIDKISSDYKGDPASALLEVLDPEQNKEFNDHYLEIEYDLSSTLFIATANSLNIPKPLLDRMELIKVPSYLEYEKEHIAEKYIVPKKMIECGLNKKEFSISPGAIQDVIRYYTREAGVRELSRKIETICRKSVLENVMTNSKKKIQITSKNLKKFLGIRKFTNTEIDREPTIGVVNGLAYTEVGGDVLLIEAVKIANGKADIKFTGTLGDVMKESLQTAFSFVKANAEYFKINLEDLAKYDIHIHAPDGATPKDGPSAGITIITALVSLFTNKPISNLLGMTGEITLRGEITAIGGLREKLTSAHRSGIKTVIIPQENEKDIEELPSYIKNELEIKTFSKVIDAVQFIMSY